LKNANNEGSEYVCVYTRALERQKRKKNGEQVWVCVFVMSIEKRYTISREERTFDTDKEKETTD